MSVTKQKDFVPKDEEELEEYLKTLGCSSLVDYSEPPYIYTDEGEKDYNYQPDKGES